MKSQRYSLFIILAVLLSTAFTLSDSNAVHEIFESIDVNSDGKITPGEFRKDMKEEAFQKLDANDDKMIEKEEWKSHKNISDRDKHVELFDRIDKDKDKRISFFEFSDYADRKSNIDEAFMGLDKDGSNSLTPDEITVRPMFKWMKIRF